MATIRFFIRAGKTEERDVSVWANVFISKSEKGRRIQFQVNTDIKVPIERWDEITGRVRVGGYTKEENDRGKKINARLDSIVELLKDGITEHETFSADIARSIIRSYIENMESEVSEIPADIQQYIKWLIEEMRIGRRLYKGNRYSQGTIKQYGNLLNVMRDFSAFYRETMNMPLIWECFRKQATCDLYMTFLSKGYNVSSRNKYVSATQTLIRYAKKDGLHSHDGHTFLYQIEENSDNMKKKIYLTDEEIQALYEMKLPEGSKYEEARDVFLAGCYTAQRISDYNNLSTRNFTTTENGIKIVKLVQKKTGARVVIPILNENLLHLANKYSKGFPEIADQTVNKYIKRILERLSDTLPSLKKNEKTILDMREQELEDKGKTVFERDEDGDVIKPRYQLVVTHTARRSCLTNLYKLHIFSDEQIMSISGHKDKRTFYSYILLSGEEVAEEITAKLKELEKQKKEEKKVSSNENLF